MYPFRVHLYLDWVRISRLPGSELRNAPFENWGQTFILGVLSL